MNLITAIKTAWRNRALLRAPTALALTCEEYSSILALREFGASLSADMSDDHEVGFYLLDRDGQGYCVSITESGALIGAHPVGG